MNPNREHELLEQILSGKTVIEWNTTDERDFILKHTPKVKTNEPFKDKKGKLRFDLIPPEMDRAFAEVATYGIQKLKSMGVTNPERNWETGLKLVADHIAALKRHVNAWELGHDIDKESGIHALKHAMWHLVAVVTQIERKRHDLDDRPIKHEVHISKEDIKGQFDIDKPGNDKGFLDRFNCEETIEEHILD